ncbi:hypothetical protein BYT27DRAFT_7183442 [Phlegmacium glaucopus]|nr:hypothetical protein BYT27DRAFT_7183442 [Phlegmacium glaucopus]
MDYCSRHPSSFQLTTTYESRRPRHLEVVIYTAGSKLIAGYYLLEGNVWVEKSIGIATNRVSPRQYLHDSVYITQALQIFDNDDGVKDAGVDSVGV